MIDLASHSLLSHIGVAVRSSPNLPLRVGENATLTCTNDVGVVAPLIEWRSSDGTVLARATLVNMLELLLSPVNDSLSVHGAVFTCHVTRNSTMFTQSLSVTVIGESTKVLLTRRICYPIVNIVYIFF